jgi:hypothetical protein
VEKLLKVVRHRVLRLLEKRGALPPCPPTLFPPAGEEEARAGKEAAARTEGMKQRTRREDRAELLSRTFDLDVLACVRSGGRLKGVGGP